MMTLIFAVVLPWTMFTDAEQRSLPLAGICESG